MMNRYRMQVLAAAALTFGLSACTTGELAPDPYLAADAADPDAIEPLEEAAVVSLESWDYDALYDGWAAEKLLDQAEVVSRATGEQIGDVENILIGPDGQILSLMVEVGGFLDIGDTHVSVPWRQVTMSPDLQIVSVPLTQDNVEDYSLYREPGRLAATEARAEIEAGEDLNVGSRVWKASELLGDYVFVEDGTGYGWLDDLIFSDAGKLQAVIVDPDVTYARRGLFYGPYAYPWYGFGFDPGLDFYDLHYDLDEAMELDPFDYGLLDGPL